MIYILCGNDTKKRSSYIKKLANNNEIIFLSLTDAPKDVLNNYAQNISLFGESPVVVIENLFSKSEESLNVKELTDLKNSPTIFVILEDKMLAAEEKKYKKYAEIEKFEIKEIKQISKIDPFALADAYARRDKIGSWILYRESIDTGSEPEAISGMLFWKIKTMILNGNKVFSLDELKTQSSNLVSLYHNAHKGNCDFVVGLEQFILSSLNK